MVQVLYVAAKVYRVFFLAMFLFISIDRTNCIGLALATAAIESLQCVLELPTISIFIWGSAVIFLYIFGCYIWRPSRRLLFVLADVWQGKKLKKGERLRI